MKSYTSIKADLKRLGLVSERFTRGFYNDYVSARTEIIRNAINGVDRSYCKDGVYLTHEMDKIYNSDFYKNEGYMYCEFLSAFLDGLRKYKIDCYTPDQFGYPVLVHSTCRYYDDLEEAKSISAVTWSDYPIIDVTEVTA